MNRLNIVFLFGALCLLVAPALTLPTDASAEKVETTTDAGRDVDDDYPITKAPTVSAGETTDAGRDVDDDYPITKAPIVTGGESGIIKRVGFNGTFHCKQITCPPGTETCKYNSKYLEDGKTAEVHYTCLDSKDTVLLEETKKEAVEHKPGFDFDDFFNGIFKFPTFNWHPKFPEFPKFPGFF